MAKSLYMAAGRPSKEYQPSAFHQQKQFIGSLRTNMSKSRYQPSFGPDTIASAKTQDTFTDQDQQNGQLSGTHTTSQGKFKERSISNKRLLRPKKVVDLHSLSLQQMKHRCRDGGFSTIGTETYTYTEEDEYKKKQVTIQEAKPSKQLKPIIHPNSP